ncbi:MAG TPA: response regulator [Bryobacteraceae bacterium]|nr:response regulator [Bryobacteraceae bacterium]
MQQPDKYVEGTQLNILLVEDNPGDVVLFKQALRNSAISYSLTVATDGVQATQMLNALPQCCSSYKPDVVFLDLNLPGKRGAEVLAEMKNNTALATIPVAILTGSDHADDRAICTSLGANAYFNKAVVLEDFAILASEIISFLTGVMPASFSDSISFCPTISLV